MKRILVTGSRNWTDEFAVREAIAKAITDTPYGTHVVIVHGDCPTGVDQITQLWLDSIEGLELITQETHSADWDAYGKGAGPRRNQWMVDRGADVCLAFPLTDSKGTLDCMRRAEKAGIPVINYGAQP